MKMNKKWMCGLTATMLAGAITIGGTMAYLTDKEVTVNEFTVGNVDIDLDEPGWDKTGNVAIEPTEVIPKDPQLLNSGKNDAFVYLQVSIPVRNVATADAEGNKIAAAEHELFTFQPSTKWTQLSSVRSEGYQVYTYAYNEILAPNAKTEPLFNNVTFINVLSGELNDQNIDIPVKGYAIQTTNTGGTGTIQEQAAAAFEKIATE